MRLLATLFLLAAGACDTAGPRADDAPLQVGGVRLTANDNAYRPGAPIRLTLVNGDDGDLTTGVLECAVLERWTGTAWVVSDAGNDRACIEIALVLAPGDEVTGDVRVRVPDGSYRLVHWVSTTAASGARVATGAFRVE